MSTTPAKRIINYLSVKTDRQSYTNNNSSTAKSPTQGQPARISAQVLPPADDGQRQRQMVVTNISQEMIAYRIQTNAPGDFQVRPNKGFMEKGGKVDIDISLVEGKLFHANHKFQLQAIPVMEENVKKGDEQSNKDSVWKNADKSQIHQIRLDVNQIQRNIDHQNCTTKTVTEEPKPNAAATLFDEGDMQETKIKKLVKRIDEMETHSRTQRKEEERLQCYNQKLEQKLIEAERWVGELIAKREIEIAKKVSDRLNGAGSQDGCYDLFHESWADKDTQTAARSGGGSGNRLNTILLSSILLVLVLALLVMSLPLLHHWWRQELQLSTLPQSAPSLGDTC